MDTSLEVNEAAQAYIDRIAPEHRPLFDRIRRLVTAQYPTATVVLKYRMPAYVVGTQSLFVGVWKHGVSLYGWHQGSESGFADRHPSTKTNKGTIRLRPEDAGEISDDELLELVRGALDD
jgi:uncharacterized protein YdhG (YjbR/CyaY superfamily)